MRISDNIRAQLSTAVGLASGLGWVGSLTKAVTPVDASFKTKVVIGSVTALATGTAALVTAIMFPQVLALVGLSGAVATAATTGVVAAGTGAAYAIGGGLGEKKPEVEAPRALMHRPF